MIDKVTGFRDFFSEVPPLKFKEPLAETLGAFQNEGTVLEYSFTETVKMAGHACPTVAGAYLSCQKALEKLYPGETPVRGNIAITVYGEPDEGVYGVIGQVFSFLTGAAPASGFRGLGPKFKRKDLLKFSSDPAIDEAGKIDPQTMCFEFRRLDNNKAVRVKLNHRNIPSSGPESARMGELMEKVLWEAASPEEKKEFQDLWVGKVKLMLVEQKGIENWLKVESIKNM
ncbi:MAG: hypothetical protein AAB019_04815 [Planctomycetota bacterium]